MEKCRHENFRHMVRDFGDGPEADEIFMAWYFAKYIGYVAKAGKS